MEPFIVYDELSKRCNVLGVGIHPVNIGTAVETLIEAIRERRKGYVCVTGVHGVMEAQKNPDLRTVLNKALLNVPDGMPTVWVGKQQGFDQMDRVYGPDLMAALCEISVHRTYRHFLYGGKEGVAEELKAKLEEKHPGIQIVGTYTPPFRALNEEEERDLKEQVARVQPDFFWVGLSTPKQEIFMASHLSRLDTRLMLGVGAAFDIHTDRIQDAPYWMKRAGLQWFHRLCQEPKRLGKRYLINNPIFISKILTQISGMKNYSLK